MPNFDLQSITSAVSVDEVKYSSIYRVQAAVEVTDQSEERMWPNAWERGIKTGEEKIKKKSAFTDQLQKGETKPIHIKAQINIFKRLFQVKSGNEQVKQQWSKEKGENKRCGCCFWQNTIKQLDYCRLRVANKRRKKKKQTKCFTVFPNQMKLT